MDNQLQQLTAEETNMVSGGKKTRGSGSGSGSEGEFYKILVDLSKGNVSAAGKDVGVLLTDIL